MQWETTVAHDVITAPVLKDDAVFLATFDGSVSCFDAETGELRWTEMMNATSAPWIYEGKVFVAQRGQKARANPYQDRTQPKATKAQSDDRGLPSHQPYERTATVDVTSGEALAAGSFGLKQAAYLDPNWGAARKSSAASDDASVGFVQAPASAKLADVSSLVGEASR